MVNVIYIIKIDTFLQKMLLKISHEVTKKVGQLLCSY